MKKSDSLGDRMKGYENVSRTYLPRRTPVIIRIDGKAFHTWTKRLKHVDKGLKDDPFSEVMHKTMTYTTDYLVRNIQNAVFGYTQSDEISILLNDWKTFDTDSWFGNNIQKMASVAASMATAVFNEYVNDLTIGSMDLAMFDARVFTLPKEEVANYFIWRQQDATRNSVQMLGRHYFSHKELHQKNNSQIQDMLMLDKGVNWNDLDTWKKRGTCVRRAGYSDPIELPNSAGLSIRHPITHATVDLDIPIFTQDRAYVEDTLKAVEV